MIIPFIHLRDYLQDNLDNLKKITKCIEIPCLSNINSNLDYYTKDGESLYTILQPYFAHNSTQEGGSFHKKSIQKGNTKLILKGEQRQRIVYVDVKGKYIKYKGYNVYLRQIPKLYNYV